MLTSGYQSKQLAFTYPDAFLRRLSLGGLCTLEVDVSQACEEFENLQSTYQRGPCFNILVCTRIERGMQDTHWAIQQLISQIAVGSTEIDLLRRI